MDRSPTAKRPTPRGPWPRILRGERVRGSDAGFGRRWGAPEGTQRLFDARARRLVDARALRWMFADNVGAEVRDGMR